MSGWISKGSDIGVSFLKIWNKQWSSVYFAINKIIGANSHSFLYKIDTCKTLILKSKERTKRPFKKWYIFFFFFLNNKNPQTLTPFLESSLAPLSIFHLFILIFFYLVQKNSVFLSSKHQKSDFLSLFVLFVKFIKISWFLDLIGLIGSPIFSTFHGYSFDT